MDEMLRGQRGWRELAALGDKINKFTGMIEGLIWSPRGSGCHEQPDDWAFEEVIMKFSMPIHTVIMDLSVFLRTHFTLIVLRVLTLTSLDQLVVAQPVL